jgi:hypothetical protein
VIRRAERDEREQDDIGFIEARKTHLDALSRHNNHSSVLRFLCSGTSNCHGFLDDVAGGSKMHREIGCKFSVSTLLQTLFAKPGQNEGEKVVFSIDPISHGAIYRSGHCS